MKSKGKVRQLSQKTRCLKTIKILPDRIKTTRSQKSLKKDLDPYS